MYFTFCITITIKNSNNFQIYFKGPKTQARLARSTVLAGLFKTCVTKFHFSTK